MADEVAKPNPTAPAKPVRPEPDRPAQPGRFQVTLDYLSETLDLTVQTVFAVLRGRVSPIDLLNQMALIGVDSVWIVIAIAAASGGVFALYIAQFAVSFGFTEPVGGTLAYAFLNELGPVLGGVAFAARSGAAIAAEIGTMVVTEQVDALRAMAVSPVRYLVAPRILAAVLMLPVLTVVGDCIGIFSGYTSSAANGVPPAAFIASVYKYVHPRDLINGLIKALVFGYLIGLTACHQGLRTETGATGVGQSTTRSVVLCVVFITVADLFLAAILKQM